MSWFRLNDEGAFHAKVLAAGNEAYGAWCRAGQWSSAHLTEGFIAEPVALSIAPRRVWERLRESTAGRSVGLVEERAGGWQIHDFLDCNPTAEEVRARRDRVATNVRALRSRRRPSGVDDGSAAGHPGRDVTAPVIDYRGDYSAITGEGVINPVIDYTLAPTRASARGWRAPTRVPARAPTRGRAIVADSQVREIARVADLGTQPVTGSVIDYSASCNHAAIVLPIPVPIPIPDPDPPPAAEGARAHATAPAREDPQPGDPSPASTAPPTAAASAASAATAAASDGCDEISAAFEERFQRHASLSCLDARALAESTAERFRTLQVARGTKLEWALCAIDEAAADVAGTGLAPRLIAKTVRTYVDHARPPREGGPGIVATAPRPTLAPPDQSTGQTPEERRAAFERAIPAIAAQFRHNRAVMAALGRVVEPPRRAASSEAGP